MPPTHPEILHTYRHLYTHALRACQYSKPSRYVVRDHIRAAFRSSPPSSYNPDTLARTVEFFKSAASHKGIEHKVQKNLIHVWWEREKLSRGTMRHDTYALRKHAYDDFDRTLEMLNKSMGLCIK
ncbi:hypothetical protein LTR62_006076 [Meristemomyces frigidus]|uniref:DUF1763-domain-containing protein n=1 Tax=Meristemomyces frigidus TaxID=1508187 RepID=A0AAN7YQ74_9PEZI|nr:hypothetical protein LTR62_006076 [Meristemomyces frigidus]